MGTALTATVPIAAGTVGMIHSGTAVAVVPCAPVAAAGETGSRVPVTAILCVAGVHVERVDVDQSGLAVAVAQRPLVTTDAVEQDLEAPAPVPDGPDPAQPVDLVEAALVVLLLGGQCGEKGEAEISLAAAHNMTASSCAIGDLNRDGS